MGCLSRSRSAIARRGGFTLVELLIVMLVVGILAAVAVPQFTGSTLDAKEAKLARQLADVRRAVERYQVEHRGRFPGCYSMTDGSTFLTNEADRAPAFAMQLFAPTNADGKVDPAASPGKRGQNPAYPYGPYLHVSQGRIVNPLPDKDAAGVVPYSFRVLLDTTPLTPSGAAAGAGWKYSCKTGEVIANSDDISSKGTAYSTW